MGKGKQLQYDERYVYALCEPDLWQEVRYVGVTVDPSRRLSGHMLNAALKRDVPLTRWLKSLKERHLKPVMRILDDVAWENWRDAERKWIAYFKEQGHNLTNISPGGYTVSETTIALRKSRYRPRVGQKNPEHSARMKKRYEDLAARQKTAEATKKAWTDPEKRARIMAGLSREGHKHSPLVS